MPRSHRSLACLLQVLAALLLAVPPVFGQARSQAGVVEAALLLRQLDGVKRVLMIGAHPDDENSALLATLARGMGAETAYLSLTRGDGGQNLIGPELMEGLGIVRTGELAAARAIDGGRQFFTRAIDYGFSKSADEAFAHWPREELLRDVVWVIRVFRPHVIVSVFSGTPSDGHGQHQAAGIMAREGFSAAGDPDRFPDQLDHVDAWRPIKLLRNARRDPEGTPMIVIETGAFDPVLGRSWYQVAMEGRSQHRSQDMGAAQRPGPRTTSLVLVDAVREIDPTAGLFAGVDTTLAGLAVTLRYGDRATVEIDAYRTAIRETEAALGVSDPGRAVPPLARALGHLDALAGMAPASGAEDAPVPDRRSATEFGHAVAHHAAVAQRALLAAAGIVVDAATEDDLLVPGQETFVTVQVWNGGRYRIERARPRIVVPAGWRAFQVPARASDSGRGGAQPPPTELPASGGPIEPGRLARWSFRVAVPADAAPTEPYFMRDTRVGDLYRWPADPGLHGLPSAPPPIEGGADLEVAVGESAEVAETRLRLEAPFVGVAQASGEFREPVLVVPAVSVAIDQPTMVWPLSDSSPREIAVRVKGEADEGVRGSVRLEAPTGWTVAPASAAFEVNEPGAISSVSFLVSPPSSAEEATSAAADRVELRAIAEGVDGRQWDRTVEVVDYPHIRRAAYLVPAGVEVIRVPVRVAEGLRVGYVMGTGDGGFEALRQIGVDAELLTPARVSAGEFRGLDVVVVGVRAYETRSDLVSANARLLDFARTGGTVIVQYQQYQYGDGAFAPYPVRISRPHDRVTDEHASVRILDPSSPILNAPNRIASEDWNGWVHERGLYFLGEWGAPFTPLLEMADPGEEPLQGSMLVAPLGEGLYVYTGLAFFRQFPAGVPGAYRLFANLVSLDGRAWARYLEERASR